MITNPIHSHYSSRSRYCVNVIGPGVNRFEYFEKYASAMKFRKFCVSYFQTLADALEAKNTFEATILTRLWDDEARRGYGPWISVPEYLDSEMN